MQESKQLESRKAEEQRLGRSGDRTWSGLDAESEAELEAETCSLQTAGCGCNSNTWCTTMRIKHGINPLLRPVFHCHYSVSPSPEWSCLEPKAPLVRNYSCAKKGICNRKLHKLGWIQIVRKCFCSFSSEVMKQKLRLYKDKLTSWSVYISFLDSKNPFPATVQISRQKREIRESGSFVCYFAWFGGSCIFPITLLLKIITCLHIKWLYHLKTVV